jgi:hypothetical protein
MAKNQKEKVIDSLRDFVRRIYIEVREANPLPESMSDRHLRMIADVIYTASFISDLYDLEEDIYNLVVKRGLISKKGAEDLLHKAVHSAVFVKDDVIEPEKFEQSLKDALRTLGRELDATPGEWPYLIRVAGLAPNCLPAKVGKVQFQIMGEEQIKALEENLADQRLRKELRDTYLGNIGAKLLSKAVDREAALDQAIREVRRTLDTINFFANSSHPPFQGVHFVWEGNGCAELFVGFTNQKISYVHGRTKGPRIAINLEKIRESIQFSRVSDILTNDQRNEVQERVLSALEWAGRASMQDRSDQALLFYAISLENLLLGTKTNTELTHRLSVYGAYLLGINFKDRKKIYDRLKSLYKLRSNIVHNGFAAVSEIDLATIHHYAKSAIWKVLTEDGFSKIRTEEGLNEYFSSLALGFTTTDAVL